MRLDAVRQHGGWTISGVEIRGAYTELMGAGAACRPARAALAAWLDRLSY